MTKKRWLIISAVGAIVIIMVIYGLMPSPVVVDTAKVIRGNMQVTITEEGKTRVKDKFVISAPAAGSMRRITLEAGDTVKKGQIVIELEPVRSVALSTEGALFREGNRAKIIAFIQHSALILLKYAGQQ